MKYETSKEPDSSNPGKFRLIVLFPSWGSKLVIRPVPEYNPHERIAAWVEQYGEKLEPGKTLEIDLESEGSQR
jgi:hypothetical protein